MRLTKRDSGGNARKNCEDCEIKFREGCCSKQLCLNALIEKLAAYEDTGYSPLEIKSLEGEWNAMRKVVDSYRKAEEQGRLVILPCKVGDRFYRAIKETCGRPDRINEYVCIGFSCVNFDGHGLQIRAYETSDGISHGLKLDVLVSASQFGKDIFLTLEEAEAALNGR